jgi:hypothetical protein
LPQLARQCFELTQVPRRLAEHEAEIHRRHGRALKGGRGIADEDRFQPALPQSASNVDQERLRVHARSIASRDHRNRSVVSGVMRRERIAWVAGDVP